MAFRACKPFVRTNFSRFLGLYQGTTSVVPKMTIETWALAPANGCAGAKATFQGWSTPSGVHRYFLQID